MKSARVLIEELLKEVPLVEAANIIPAIVQMSKDVVGMVNQLRALEMKYEKTDPVLVKAMIKARGVLQTAADSLKSINY